MKILLRQLITLFPVILVISSGAYAAVDNSLRPEGQDEISNIFKDMGVIQRRAMAKGGRFLLSTYGSFDFSDGPYTNYSININPGYALSDYFEVYFNYVVKFIYNPRSIVNLVNQLQLLDGTQATITSSEPLSQMGAELVWAPLYGKDSLGMQRIVRSDTFLKLAGSQISYSGGKSGMRFAGGVGKTFFMGKSMGLRVCIDYGYVQTIVNDLKGFKSMAIVETGLVFYF